MKTLLFYLIISTLTIAQSSNFIRAADLSFWEELNENNAKFYHHGNETPLLNIFSQTGFTHVRLRIWHTPAEGYNDLESTLNTALAAKEAGLKLYLDFHYSDWWADPGHQNIPVAWEGLEFDALADSLYNYTFIVISALQAQNTIPEIVQLGNEISCGFLWDEARICNDLNTYDQWTKFAALLNAGKQAITDALGPDNSTQIMIHTDRGGDNASCRWFFSKLLTYGFDFDIIGLSYYPWWHGDLDNLKDNLDDLTWRYSQDIFIAETAYPFTLANQDGTNNFVWEESQLLENYPATPAGQKQYYTDLISMLESYNGKVTGVALWEPAFRGIPGMDSPWESQLLFDFIGNTLPSFEVFESYLTSFETPNSTNKKFFISHNYPNPFNSATNIDIYLNDQETLKITIWSSLGECVKSYSEKIYQSGNHRLEVKINGFPSGVYFLKIDGSNFSVYRPIMLLK